jgi:hypothetical protein
VVGRSYGEIVALENVTAIFDNFARRRISSPWRAKWYAGQMTCKLRQAKDIWPGENDSSDQNFAGCFCFWIFDMFDDS